MIQPQTFKGRLHPIRAKSPITDAPTQIFGWLTDKTGQRMNVSGRQEPDGSFELHGELIPAPAKPRPKIQA